MHASLNRETPNRHLQVAHGPNSDIHSRFELQPVLKLLNNTVWAYELLYRGSRPCDWIEVDSAVVRFLWKADSTLPRLLVNISNETLLALPPDDFFRATKCNRVIFELSESFTGEDVYKKIARKARAVSELGVKFALDDFGAGLDGLRRLYGHGDICVVKVDMDFLHMCMQNPHACETLVFLLSQWRKSEIVTIAEGVETEAILIFAQGLGFDMAQGFHVDQLVANLARPASEPHTAMIMHAESHAVSLTLQAT